MGGADHPRRLLQLGEGDEEDWRRLHKLAASVKYDGNKFMMKRGGKGG